MTPLVRRSLILLALCAQGCSGGPGAAPTGDATGPDGSTPRYTRELIFVGARGGEPLVASVVFRAVDVESQRVRGIRGWLAHGKRWEPFLEERWRGARTGTPWTLVPRGDLHIAAGGSPELESLWYRRGSRSLRLELGDPLSVWNRGGDSRVHLFNGGLRVGSESTRGMVLELLRVERGGGRAESPGGATYALLSSGDTLQIFLLADVGTGDPGLPLAWIRSGSEAREWTQMELREAGSRPLAEARRQIPRSWRFRVPEAGMQGRIDGLGFTGEIGQEREGRRAVDARYTVRGWLERGGERVELIGALRHVRD